MSPSRPAMVRLRRRMRRELSWLLVAVGVAGLVVLALDVWAVPGRHQWDVVTAAVSLAALGLYLLATPGARTGRPRRGSGARRRVARHR
jgi:hypothetical protein